MMVDTVPEMPAITVGDALSRMGITVRDDETIAIVTINSGRQTLSRPLSDVTDLPVEQNTYYSTGAFPVGTRFDRRGDRSRSNLKRIMEVPIDIDLKIPALITDRDDIYRLPNHEVEALAKIQWKDTAAILKRMGMEPHRVDYTGNGIAVLFRVADHADHDIDRIRRYHKAIVTAFNGQVMGGQDIANTSETGDVDAQDTFMDITADAQVSDAGTRIMRIPYAINEKVSKDAEILARRTPYTLYQNPDAPYYTVEQLQRFAGDPVEPVRRVDVPTAPNPNLTPSMLQPVIDAVRPEWNSGNRHNMALALSGMMAKSGVPMSQAEDVIRVIADGDEELDDRLRCVSDTYSGYRAGYGDTIAGYTLLAGSLSDGAIEKVDTALTAAWKQARQESDAKLTVEFGKNSRAKKKIEKAEHDTEELRYRRSEERRLNPEPPEIALTGWFGRYVAMAEKTTEASLGYHLMSAMTVAGSMSGRRVAVKFVGKKYPAFYVILIGKPGSSRKSTAINMAIDHFHAAWKEATIERSQTDPTCVLAPDAMEPPYKVVKTVGSGEVLVEILEEDPTVLLTYDEVSMLFDRMSVPNSTLRSRLLTAWDTPQSLENNTRQKKSKAENPFISILAGTQPKRIQEFVKREDFFSGFMTRVLFVYGTPQERKDYPPNVDTNVARQLWNDLHGAIHYYKDGTVLELSEAARQRWSEYYSGEHAQELELASERKADMIVRHPDHIMRIALMYAIVDRSPVIELRHLTIAIAINKWLWDGVKDRYELWGSSEDTQLQDYIIETFKESPVMRRSDLFKKVTATSQWRPMMSGSVIDGLVKNGVLYTEQVGQTSFLCLSDVADILLTEYDSLKVADMKSASILRGVIRARAGYDTEPKTEGNG